MLKWFSNKKISFRILFGFMTAIAIAIIVGAVGIFSLLNVNSSYEASYTDSANALDNMEEISSSFQRTRMNLYGLILADTAADKDYYYGRILDFDKIMQAGILDYMDTLSAYDESEIADILKNVNRMNDELVKYYDLRADFIENLAMDTSLRMTAYEELKDGALRTVALDVDDAMGDVIDYEVDFAFSEIERNLSNAIRSIVIMVVVLAAGLVIAIIFAVYISRGIANPINEMVAAANILADGDINASVDADTKDEVGDLAQAFRNMIENTRNQAQLAEHIADGDLTVDVHVRSEKDLLNIKFKEIVDKNNAVLTNIVNAANQVTVGSGQVSDSSIALSQGSAEQASSVEELTASLEEVSSQTDVNANNANEANQLAESAKNNAVEGNNKMHEMVEAMQEISDSSENISKVIKVIDDIAFQTNILALNAAVEAARAGQHGKGFAVVAEEVRNLAARSADAAKETADMIENSIKKSDGGTRIANETAQALNKIVDEVTKAANLVRDIAVASNEQASAIGQINQGILQVSQVVQSNAATSEETAAASEELSSQADLLQEMVAQFRLRSDAGTNLDSGYAMGNSNKKGISQDMFESLGSLKKDDKKQTDNAKAAITSGGFGKY